MKRAAFLGFLIWLASTIALRFFGQYILAIHPLILLAASAPLMALLAWALVKTPEEAIALAAPGMLLDTFVAIYFVPAASAGLFGGWLLWCNAVVLVTGGLYKLGRRP